MPYKQVGPFVRQAVEVQCDSVVRKQPDGRRRCKCGAKRRSLSGKKLAWGPCGRYV